MYEKLSNGVKIKEKKKENIITKSKTKFKLTPIDTSND